MKLFSVILSVYIMGLIFVPCNDLHAENHSDNINSEILVSHEHHFDTCSPFCICNCCQTVFQPAADNYFSYFANLVDTPIPFTRVSGYHLPGPCWRPPKA